MSQEWSRFCVATSVTRRSDAEIHEGLNVVETWNSANGFIFYGRGARWQATAWRTREVAVHALRLLQGIVRVKSILPARASRRTIGGRQEVRLFGVVVGGIAF